MSLTRSPWLYRLPILTAVAVLFLSCGRDLGNPTVNPPHKNKAFHDDPAKEKLVLVDDSTPPVSYPDPVCVSWDGTHGTCKKTFIRWVATKHDAQLTIPEDSVKPIDGPCKNAGTPFPKIECAEGECVSRDLKSHHKNCKYKYKICVDGSNCADPTIEIDP